eukprot:5923917-Karenia_brevis.AAC.1
MVKKIGPNGKAGGHPSGQAIADLRPAIDNDLDWHPGKPEETAREPGPKVKFNEQKKDAVRQAAMALKRQKLEPTASA